jgi:hypothetical protein
MRVTRGEAPCGKGQREREPGAILIGTVPRVVIEVAILVDDACRNVIQRFELLFV